ncbi:methyl-accepting chemotaxis protein [Saccharicrinis aurantiacus]|uniref:methyl-accepting chemotaxis protein n=1 Tax=Saccharicrinis aurantiacus TaxID=1849719 RepID=UPI00094F6C60|nr:PAS domain-containing protein [Saccharicrinis aurantiacus]
MIYFICFCGIAMSCYIVWLQKKCKGLKQHINTPIREEAEKSSDSFEEKDDERLAELKLLSIVAKQTDNAIMVMDIEGNIQWINDGFTRMYEYTFEAFIKQRGTNILQTSFNPLVRQCINETLSTKQPTSYEAINVTPSGNEIWTHTSLSPVLDDNGEIIHLVTVDSDISKRKNAGDKLIERVDQLTMRIGRLAKQQSEMMTFTNELFDKVSSTSKKIGETSQIVKYIHEMSDKIKIMGLNASIESQYVGDLGSGFRVISGEIVQMSEETKKYSRDISTIVDSIQVASDQLNKGKDLVEQASGDYVKSVDDLKEEVLLVEEVVAELH